MNDPETKLRELISDVRHARDILARERDYGRNPGDGDISDLIARTGALEELTKTLGDELGMFKTTLRDQERGKYKILGEG